MKQANTETLQALERRRAKLKRNFGRLLTLLLVELFIVGLVKHEYLANNYNLLLFSKIQDWLSRNFWPHPGQQEPHRMLIFNLWGTFTSLAYYPLIAWLVPKLPLLFLGVNILSFIINKLRIKVITTGPRTLNAKKEAIPVGRFRSGLSLVGKYKTRLALKVLRQDAKYDDMLFQDPGIRVQFLSANSTELRKDRVFLWNNNGEITVDAGLSEAPLFFLDDAGRAHMRTRAGTVAMQSGVPVAIRHNIDNESRILVAFTWLGGY